jgi:hypothetical protein
MGRMTEDIGLKLWLALPSLLLVIGCGGYKPKYPDADGDTFRAVVATCRQEAEGKAAMTACLNDKGWFYDSGEGGYVSGWAHRTVATPAWARDGGTQEAFNGDYYACLQDNLSARGKAKARLLSACMVAHGWTPHRGGFRPIEGAD